MNDTQFNLAYILSVSAALYSAFLIQSGTPQVPVAIKFFLIPLLVAYVTLKVLQFLFPHMNEFYQKLENYFDNRVLGMINSTNYIQVWPLILVVFVMVLAALFYA